MGSNQQGKDPQHLRLDTRSSFLGLELPFCRFGSIGLLESIDSTGKWVCVEERLLKSCIVMMGRRECPPPNAAAVQSRLVSLEVMQQECLVGHSQRF